MVDVIGYDAMYVPDHPGSCIGAAFVALEALGISKDWGALQRFLKKGTKVEYSEERHAEYQSFYRMYRTLYETLKPVFGELSTLPAVPSDSEAGRGSEKRGGENGRGKD